MEMTRRGRTTTIVLPDGRDHDSSHIVMMHRVRHTQGAIAKGIAGRVRWIVLGPRDARTYRAVVAAGYDYGEPNDCDLGLEVSGTLRPMIRRAVIQYTTSETQ